MKTKPFQTKRALNLDTQSVCQCIEWRSNKAFLWMTTRAIIFTLSFTLKHTCTHSHTHTLPYSLSLSLQNRNITSFICIENPPRISIKNVLSLKQCYKQILSLNQICLKKIECTIYYLTSHHINKMVNMSYNLRLLLWIILFLRITYFNAF